MVRRLSGLLRAGQRPERGGPDDAGFTLVELIVAMFLFSLLLGIFMSGIVLMTRDTVRVQNISNTEDEARRAFDRFDRQLRYASAVNPPGRVGNDWYFEYQTTATGSVTGQCTQWRVQQSTQQLQVRTWDDATAATASGWAPVASHVSNDPTSEVPFTFTPADTTYMHQRVGLLLEVSMGATTPVRVQASFVARNTSTSTVTNTGGLVCQQVGRP
jgi:prepilin-type N-terminal cleavage/methylation domain-containing protein